MRCAIQCLILPVDQPLYFIFLEVYIVFPNFKKNEINNLIKPKEIFCILVGFKAVKGKEKLILN